MRKNCHFQKNQQESTTRTKYDYLTTDRFVSPKAG